MALDDLVMCRVCGVARHSHAAANARSTTKHEYKPADYFDHSKLKVRHFGFLGPCICQYCVKLPDADTPSPRIDSNPLCHDNAE